MTRSLDIAYQYSLAKRQASPESGARKYMAQWQLQKLGSAQLVIYGALALRRFALPSLPTLFRDAARWNLARGAR
ncbi:unnamed protein product [Gongylonema pulchrum]|uniref:DUF418 domain-containing protein n=1 Tax=Gongylonema pulchrum TaxID=637853 RepID=A0A183EAD8_9BILA|nr:unnamed protein product [Gongylonema pulchrum]